MITGIVAALPEEIKTLTNRKIAQGECFFIADDILVVRSGAGPVNAADAVSILIANGAKAIISWGCAAALDKSLKPGNLTLPAQLVTDNGQRLPIDCEWHRYATELLASRFDVRTGSLAESSRIISSCREKQTLHNQTEAIALDMESAAIAKAAARADLPCLVVRAVADPADMDLPAAVAYAMDPSGSVDIKKLTGFVLTHPGQLPGLIELGLHFTAAARTLKSIVELLPALAINKLRQ